MGKVSFTVAAMLALASAAHAARIARPAAHTAKMARMPHFCSSAPSCPAARAADDIFGFDGASRPPRRPRRASGIKASDAARLLPAAVIAVVSLRRQLVLSPMFNEYDMMGDAAGRRCRARGARVLIYLKNFRFSRAFMI